MLDMGAMIFLSLCAMVGMGFSGIIMIDVKEKL